MPSLAKQPVSLLLRLFPRGVRRSLIKSILFSGDRQCFRVLARDYQLFGELAKAHGICGYIADGRSGLIQGDIADGIIFRSYADAGAWEENLTATISAFLADGGVYLDIGGNIGLTTIPVARNANVECIVFEPHPGNFRHLTANLLANCPNDNVTAHNLALFDQASSVCFEISPVNSGDHRIRPSAGMDGSLGEADWQTIEVGTVRLDDMNITSRRPMVAKIDVQGAEPFVLAGGGKTLAQADLLAIEFWPYAMARMGADPDIVIRFLEDNFESGIVNRGWNDVYDSWQPIGTIIPQLEDLVRNPPDDVNHQLDILVKRGE